MILEFRLTHEPILAHQLCWLSNDAQSGACITFEGTIRNHNQGKKIQKLEYQCYEKLALNHGNTILQETAQQYDILGAYAIHRLGMLQIGDVAILLRVIASHRGAAFDAARIILERLKFELPIWKKEYTLDGDYDWLSADGTSIQ